MENTESGIKTNKVVRLSEEQSTNWSEVYPTKEEKNYSNIDVTGANAVEGLCIFPEILGKVIKNRFGRLTTIVGKIKIQRGMIDKNDKGGTTDF